MADIPNLLLNEVLVDIGKNHNKTVAQVALRYQLERDIIVIPKSSNPERIKQNFDVSILNLLQIPETLVI